MVLTPTIPTQDPNVEPANVEEFALKTRTMTQWYADPPKTPTWLVDGLLLDGGVSIIAAKPKVGKSTWARNLAAFVAMKWQFMGKLEPRHDPRPVLYYGLEDMESVIFEHFKALHVPATDLLISYTGTLPTEDPWNPLIEQIEKHHPSLVILDPYARFLRVKDWSNYGEVTERTQPLISISREYGVHITGTHHMRKSKSDDNNGMDEVLGSAQVTGFVDTMILLKRLNDKDNTRTIRTIQRYGDDMPETNLVFDAKEKRFDLGSKRWEAELDADLDAIVGVMEVGDWYEEGQFTFAVGNRADRIKALQSGADSGRFLRRGKGKRGSPYEFSLAVSEAPDL